MLDFRAWNGRAAVMADPRVEVETDLLRPVLEMSVAVARQGYHDKPVVQAPRPLRPFLEFAKLPARALVVAQRCLDEDAEFRERVASRFRPGDLDDGPLAWLCRPEGWEDAWDVAVNEALGQAQRSAHEARIAALEADLAAASDQTVQLNEQLAAVAAARDAIDADLEVAQRHIVELTGAVDRAEHAESERRRAVRDLKAMERRLHERTAEAKRLAADNAQLRELLTAARSELEAAVAEHVQLQSATGTDLDEPAVHPDELEADITGQPSDLDASEGPAELTAQTAAMPFDPARLDAFVLRDDLGSVAAELGRAAGAAAALARSLGTSAQQLAALMGPPGASAERGPDATDSDADGGARGGDRPDDGQPPRQIAQRTESAIDGRQVLRDRMRGGAHRPQRRMPIRVGRGLTEGSPGAVEALLSVPEVVVLVDGYNASLTLWPDLDLPNQREALIGGMGRLALRLGPRVHIIFDGDAGGGPPSVTAPLPVRVQYTTAEIEADDVLIEMAQDLPPELPVLVVSADRRVQAGVKAFGANVVAPVALRPLLCR